MPEKNCHPEKVTSSREEKGWAAIPSGFEKRRGSNAVEATFVGVKSNPNLFFSGKASLNRSGFDAARFETNFLLSIARNTTPISQDRKNPVERKTVPSTARAAFISKQLYTA